MAAWPLCHFIDVLFHSALWISSGPPYLLSRYRSLTIKISISSRALDFQPPPLSSPFQASFSPSIFDLWVVWGLFVSPFIICNFDFASITDLDCRFCLFNSSTSQISQRRREGGNRHQVKNHLFVDAAVHCLLVRGLFTPSKQMACGMTISSLLISFPVFRVTVIRYNYGYVWKCSCVCFQFGGQSPSFVWLVPCVVWVCGLLFGFVNRRWVEQWL